MIHDMKRAIEESETGAEGPPVELETSTRLPAVPSFELRDGQWFVVASWCAPSVGWIKAPDARLRRT
jgi:hypothetical protein